MTHTIIGQVITADGMAQQTYLHQPDLELVGPLTYRKPAAQLRTRSFALNAAAVRTVQPSFIAIDVDHSDDDVLGRVTHLEFQHDGLWLVGRLHTDLPRDRPLYLSPRSSQRRDGTDLLLESVAVTSRPAQICMQPIVVLDGDIEHRHRHDWQVADRHEPMLQRAHTAMRSRGSNDPIIVRDTDGGMVDERPVGPMRYRTGRILRVY